MNLSDEILSYLLAKDWALVKETDLFYYMAYSADEKTDINIKLPKSFNSPDYNSYIEKIIFLLSKLYPNRIDNPKSKLTRFQKINKNQKRRFLKKDDWILPEEKSRIDKIDIYDTYVPK